ncbi:MAG TPA: hypothetical protein VN408_14180 [Actinoplanes sp.]|nr:hypothetical protein [Actinoplanes sp.]
MRRGKQIQAMFTAEMRLMKRNSAILGVAIAMPTGVAAYFVWSSRDGLGPLGWAFPVAILSC